MTIPPRDSRSDASVGASRLGPLAVDADRACALGDVVLLGEIVESLAVRAGEPLHCELVALGELCRSAPERAAAAWMQVRDRVLAAPDPIAP